MWRTDGQTDERYHIARVKHLYMLSHGNKDQDSSNNDCIVLAYCILCFVIFSVKWSKVPLAGSLFWAISMQLIVWTSDITEWRSVNWHLVIRYSDRVNWVMTTWTGTRLHSGSTISVSAISETMSSSNMWINIGNVNTPVRLMAYNNVCTFCVDNSKHRW